MNEDVTDFTTPDRKAKNDGSNRWKDTLSTLLIIILAPIVALFLVNFVFQSYQVDGPSMETTLQNGDRLIVTKTGKTWSKITGKDYVPKRYEIIIFNLKGDINSGAANEKQLVKRVIGLPGDRVVVKDGVVTVFNSEFPDGHLIDQDGPEKFAITTTTGEIDEVVPIGSVYVMGDNRNNSLDSRAFGPVPSHDIVGMLKFRIYPFDKVDKY
ncbi:MAG: signal peptidase I [Candidatus Saccharimonadales bacterium]